MSRARSGWVVLLALCLASPTHAELDRAASVAHDVLNVSTDARDGALGEALTAEANGAASSLRNPALLAGLGSRELRLTGGAWIAQTSHSAVAYAHPLLLRRRPSAAGASLFFSGSGALDGRDALGSPISVSPSRAYGVQLTLAHSWSERLRLGLAGRFVRDFTAAPTVEGSLGAAFRVGPRSEAALALTEFAPGGRFRTPASVALGGATRIVRNRILLAADLRFPVAERPWIRAGLEWLAYAGALHLHVRAGVRLHLGGIAWGSGSAPSLGLGLATRPGAAFEAGADWAVVPYGNFGDAGSTQRLTLRIALGTSRASGPSATGELRTRAELSSDGRSVVRAVLSPALPSVTPSPAAWALAVTHPARGEVARVRKNGAPPSPIEWDGKDGKGAPVADSANCLYSVELFDENGRLVARTEPQPIAGATGGGSLNPEADVQLAARAMAIDSARLKLPELKRLPEGASWRVVVADAAGKEIGRIEGQGAPPRILSLPAARFAVEGKTAGLPVGASYRFAAVDPRGIELFSTQAIPLVPKSRQLEHAEALRPKVTVETLPERDVTGRQITRVQIRTRVENETMVQSWNFRVTDAAGAELARAANPAPDAPIPRTIHWNGKAADGKVRSNFDEQFYRFTVTDVTGTERVVTGPMLSKASLAEAKEFGGRPVVDLRGVPSGSGAWRFELKPQLSVAFTSWRFTLVDESGGIVLERSGSDRPPSEILWNGRRPDGSIVAAADRLRARLEIEDPFETSESIELAPALAAAADQVITLTRRVRISDFEFGESEIRPYMFVQFAKAAEIVRRQPGARVDVHGHTDSVGSDESNQRLSTDRARSAAAYLEVKENTDLTGMTIAGLGATRPVDSNDTEAGRAHNRRVEISVTSVALPGAPPIAPSSPALPSGSAAPAAVAAPTAVSPSARP